MEADALRQTALHLTHPAKEGFEMFKKILFGTCLTEYCDHVFNFALNLARENNAKLWIYHGLGPGTTTDDIKKAAEGKVAEAYVRKMKDRGFTDYMINVSDGDVVSGLAKLARDAQIDLLVMGTSTQTPLEIAEAAQPGKLGPTAAETLLASPCPVLVVPPSMIPGLAQG
jgi:nucleotide-binding universal stress UspA family protein